MPGGYGRGNRYRWWYRMTGKPAWQRFGDDPRYDSRFDPRNRDFDDYPPEEIPPLVPPPREPIPERYPPYRPMPYHPYQRWTTNDELRMLEEEEKMLEDELNEIKKRIEDLKKEKEVK